MSVELAIEIYREALRTAALVLLVLGRALPTRQELPPRTHSGVAQELSA
ncbi:MAG: hypothetical protein V3T14_00810 [Myxococcota bacterium]